MRAEGDDRSVLGEMTLGIYLNYTPTGKLSGYRKCGIASKRGNASVHDSFRNDDVKNRVTSAFWA